MSKEKGKRVAEFTVHHDGEKFFFFFFARSKW